MWNTSDLYDNHQDSVHIVDPLFTAYGAASQWHGKIETLYSPHHSERVLDKLREDGNHRILVIDGGGITNWAIFDEESAQTAIHYGWEGILLYGSVRHVEQLKILPIGIYALAATPQHSSYRAISNHKSIITFGSVIFSKEDWLYADSTGILTSSSALF